MAAKLKVYLLPTQNNGCGKYRSWNPAAALERSGLVEVQRGPDVPAEITVERCEDIFRWADVVHTQTLTSLWASTFFVATRDCYKKKLIVDLDDSIWDVHPMNIGTVNDSPFRLNDHFSDDPNKFWDVMEMTDEQWNHYVDSMDEVDKGFMKKPTFLHGTMVELDGKKLFVKQKHADARSAAQFYLNHADAITTTNLFLASRIRKHTGQQNIHILPNCLNMREWSRKPVLSEYPTISWCGSVSHYIDFLEIVPMFDKLMKEFPRLKMQMMGSCFGYFFPPREKGRDIGGYGGDSNELSYYDFAACGERYPGRISFTSPAPIQEYEPWLLNNWRGHIGVAPLENHPFNKAKSCLKWIEYSMLGVPTVASRVGPYQREIRHNHDGKLCGSNGSWFKALAELIDSPKLRNELAQAAEARVREDFDIDKQIHRWIEVYENTIHGSDARPASGSGDTDVCAGSRAIEAGA